VRELEGDGFISATRKGEIMADGSRVADLLEDRPDLESPLAAILAVDEEANTWTFDDIPVDSGAFGELVSRGIVEKAGGEYRLTNPDAVRTALDGTAPAETDSSTAGDTDLSFDVSLRNVNAQAVGLLVGALALIVVVRSFIAGSVFRSEHVVLVGNDPYLYRFWVERMLVSGDSLAAVSGPINGEPLMIATLARIAGLFGGVDAAGTVLAVYPVVSAVITGLVLYLFTMRLTADRRVALATVVMLAVTPGHALRTALGFADHHAFDYVWLALTALALLVLVTEQRPQLTDPRTALATVGLGVGVGGQILAWDNGALLLVPVASVVAGHGLLAIRADRSPAVATAPVAVGLALAALLTAVGHVQLGWHSPAVASIPAVLFVGTVGVAAVGELVHRAGRSARELAVGEAFVAVIVAVGLVRFVPDLQDRLLRGLGLIGRTDDIAEVRGLFSGDSLGFLLLFGLLLAIALPMLAFMSWRVSRGSDSWLVACVYAWYFFVLSLFQVRFVGEVGPFLAIFAGFGFVWLAAKIDLTAPPAPWGDPSEMADWTPGRPDASTVAAVLVLFALVGGLGVMQSAVTVEQLSVEDETYETAAWMADYADERGWETPEESYVFSRWGQNRLYNYFVNGDSESYGYAQSNYGPFLSATDPQAALDSIDGRVRFVVTEDQNAEDIPPESIQARLHEDWGSHSGSVEGVGQFRALYASESGARKVFMPVSGAHLVGQAAPDTTVEISTPVDIPGAEFTYERTVRTTPIGVYRVTVPYPGTYTIENTTIDVSESAIEGGRRHTDLPAEGLAYWSFDEGRGDVADDTASGYRIDGLSGRWTDGINRGAIAFGNGSVEVTSNDSLPQIGPNESFTVSLYIKGNFSATDDTYPRVLQSSQFGFWARNDALDFGIRIDNADSDSDVRNFGIKQTDFQSWTHVAAVLDRSNDELRLYRDGELVSTRHAAEIGEIRNALPNRLGPRATLRENPMAIDELRVYRRALSQSELNNRTTRKNK